MISQRIKNKKKFVLGYLSFVIISMFRFPSGKVLLMIRGFSFLTS